MQPAATVNTIDAHALEVHGSLSASHAGGAAKNDRGGHFFNFFYTAFNFIQWNVDAALYMTSEIFLRRPDVDDRCCWVHELLFFGFSFLNPENKRPPSNAP